MVNADFKIKVLLAACILIVSTLSLIQYYLVKNTYQLTKDKYYAEVQTAFGKIINTPAIAAVDVKVLDNLKQIASVYVTRRPSKQKFLQRATKKNDSVIKVANNYLNAQIKRNPKLKGIRYQSRYDQIILEVNGHQFTLLSPSDKPFVYIGQLITPPNALLLNNGSTETFENKNVKEIGRSSSNTRYLLKLKRSVYIDVSGWKQEVLKRMAGIFFLAAGLILAVIVLFYLVFSTMLRQKRIADIKTDFANNITHELKTPLSSVNVILTTLKRKEAQANPAMFNSLLQSLYRQHAKIQQTVDSVLESAMLTDLRVEQADLDITDYLLQYTEDLMLASHQMVAHIEQVRQMIKIHQPTLEKALNNIIDNAVKYSPEGSEVTFKAFVNQGYYTIEVTDQGPGIAHDHQSQIFDKFYRIPEQNKHTVKGLGLGLYISKQAITQLGGSLAVTTVLEKGSTFTIKLPVHEG